VPEIGDSKKSTFEKFPNIRLINIIIINPDNSIKVKIVLNQIDSLIP
jgi:hypothetical protein